MFAGRFGGHKTIQNSRASEAAFRRAGVTDVASHNLRKMCATPLVSPGATVTDVQHVPALASVKTTEKAYAAFVKNERFKRTMDLLDKPVVPKLKIVGSFCTPFRHTKERGFNVDRSSEKGQDYPSIRIIGKYRDF